MTIIEDIRKLQDTMRIMDERCEANRAAIARLDEQISGERGISAALNALAAEVKSLRRAAYWVAGLIVAGSVTFAFSVLQLVG